MQVGLALPQYDFSVAGEVPLDWSTVVSYATEAERVGFDSLWLADHLTLSVEKYGAPPGEHRGIDPITGLAALARLTRRPTLGTLVLCAPLRPVTVLAKQLAGVDLLSGGRLVVGLGAGWHPPDFAAVGLEFPSPGRRLADLAAAADALRIVWRGEPGAPPCLPAPAQAGGPPVWIGGRGDRLLSEVARHADGWNMVWAATPESYRERLSVLERACERISRDPSTVTRSLGLFTLIGENEADLRRRFAAMADATPKGVLDGVTLDEWRSGHLVGTVEQVQDQVGAWADLGVAHLVIGLGAVPFQGTSVDDLSLIATALVEE